MFILLMSNLSSLTLNPVCPKWTPNVVVIHVHCRKHIYQIDLKNSALKLHPSSLILADPVNKQYIRTIKKIQETIILFLNAHLRPPILRISDRAHIETLGLLPLLKLRCYKR